jgi:hypothetical protein
MVRLLILVLLISGLLPLGAQPHLVRMIDYSSQPSGNALPWLRQHGYELGLDFASLHPRFEGGALRLTADEPARGVATFTFSAGQELHGVKQVRITWGVSQFPSGADWEKGINRVAIGIMISFGTEKLPSGLPLGISSAPYFVCPFLANKEPSGKVYVGQYWKEGGRYLACKTTQVGSAVTTDVPVDELFQQLFKKAPTPPITAVGIQVNSMDTEGAADAFVSKIEFLD